MLKREKNTTSCGSEMANSHVVQRSCNPYLYWYICHPLRFKIGDCVCSPPKSSTCFSCLVAPRRISAYDGIVDVYVDNLLPNLKEMTFPALSGTTASGLKVQPIKVTGISSFQRSCAVTIFRTALNVQLPADPPLTYLRACGSMNNVTFSTTVEKGGKTAVSFLSAIFEISRRPLRYNQCLISENMIYLQAVSIRFTGLSIGFTMRVLNGPINNIDVKSLRVTDAEFVEYEGYHYDITGDQGISGDMKSILERLKDATKAAKELKSFMNTTILPKYDLKPL